MIKNKALVLRTCSEGPLPKKTKGPSGQARGSLLLILALFALTACDDQSTSGTPDASAKTPLGSAASFMALGMPDPEPSWAGAFISARIAQDELDWGRAQTFLKIVNTDTVGDAQNTRRLMLLSAGAGDISGAIEHAKSLSAHPDPSGLTSLILVMGPIRANDADSARTILDQMPKSSLTNFASPILRAWVDATGSRPPPKTLADPSSLYEYHRFLIADFKGNIDAFATPAFLTRIRNELTPVAAERVGDVFLRHQKFDLALESYRLTQLMNPHTVQIAQKIKATEDKQTDVSALNIAPKVTSMSGGAALVFFDMAATFFNDQSIESALVFAQLSTALDPTLTESRLLIGNILSSQNQKNAAIQIYEKIAPSDPRYNAVQQKIASLRVDMGQDDLAIQTLRDLVARDIPVDQKQDYLIQIGDIERENEKFDAALSAYNAAFALIEGDPKPDHWDLLYARGMTYERLKQWDKAEVDLRAALKFQPDHPYIMNYLAYSWADQNMHLDQATDMLLKAVDIVPNDGYVTDSVGWVYYRQGKFEEAVKYLERAVELLPYDATVNDHLGDAYWSVGRKREARFQWNRAANYSKDADLKITIEKKIDAGL
jgi:tetratricopeptide (TPR) repeat protein